MPRQAGLTPTSPGISARMRRQRSRDTKPERALRAELYSRGLRYRVHRRPISTLRRQADIVFLGARLAVFVDGCWWHACPLHASWPQTNEVFWRSKIERNRERDRETTTALVEAGWLVERVWEHEGADVAASRIAALVRQRRAEGSRRLP